MPSPFSEIQLPSFNRTIRTCDTLVATSANGQTQHLGDQATILTLTAQARTPPLMSARFRPLGGDNGHAGDEGVEDEAQKIYDLNRSLHILATIFPGILPEVFREALQAFSGKSRLQIAVDQLIKNQDKWVRGRRRTGGNENNATTDDHGRRRALIAAEDEFRRSGYKWAVYSSLCQEFKVLNKSAIKAVLAEENHSYTRARLTLQKLAAKSWRSALNAIWARWRKPAEETKQHYMIIWRKDDADPSNSFPLLKETGDPELDVELYQQVLEPYLENVRREQELKDWEIANVMNEKEAEEADALYECQCCFTNTTFEQMAACTTKSHALCYRCIRHAVAETLFGQGWGRNIDHTRGLLKCLAPSSREACDGCIPHCIVERALVQSKGGSETWNQLEARLTDEALAKTSLPFVRCPFCSYAEIDELYLPPSTVRYKPNTIHLRNTFILLMITFNFIPLIMLYSLLCRSSLFNTLPTPTDMVSTSCFRLTRSKHLSRRFQCRSQACGLFSCLNCSKAWRDPHICHESAALSLRATIESARTAALKRTCPRCSLAFIKDSGCNKLTCICGYSMCYICRQGLGKGEGGEGYRHFCQHFRPMGGVCKDCDKCDLYKNLDDHDIVLTAGIKAEKEWREREGMVGVDGIGGGEGEPRQSWLEREWTMQAVVDWWVAGLVTC